MTAHSAKDVRAAEPTYLFGEYVLRPRNRTLVRAGTPVRIGSRAFELLTMLVEHAGETVSKSDLLSRAWPTTFVGEANLKVNIAALRRALGEARGGEQFIVTVSGRGYRFVAPIESEVDGPPAGGTGDISVVRPRVARVLGRSHELEVLAEALTMCRLISIVGPGGVGKTTVAMAAGSAAAAAFPGGVGLVDLSSIGSPQFIVVAIAAAFGITPTGADPLASLIQAFRRRRMMILIDNCEHLLPSLRPVLDRLLGALDHVTIMATSREPLGMAGEVVVRLDGLRHDTPESPSAGEASQFSAVQLFAERSRDRSGLVLSDQNAPQVAAICRRLDGNALAIELAATQTVQFAPDQILRMLDDCVKFLRLGPADAPMRQQSLAATLDWSYRLLSPSEAGLMRAVSLFGRRFGVGDAADVSGADRDDVEGLLLHLARKSMLIHYDEGVGPQFHMLETTRRYCFERLQLSTDYTSVRRRHAEYVCLVLETASEEWARTPSVKWGATYAPLLEELTFAIEWAGSDGSDPHLLIRLAVSGTVLWNHFSLHQECRARTSSALASIQETGFHGTTVEMKLLVSFVRSLYTIRGVSDVSYRSTQRALDLARQIGTLDDQLKCLYQLYIHNIVAGRLNVALEQIQTIIATAPPTNPAAEMAQVALGLLEFWMGRFDSSKQRLAKVVKPSGRAINHARRAEFLYEQNTSAQNVLANVQWITGHPDTAMATAVGAIESGLQLKHDLSLIGVLAVAACKIALLNGSSEKLDEHLRLFEHALARSGLETWRPWAEFYRGAQACRRDSDDEKGLDVIARSIADLIDMNHRQRLPFLLAVHSEMLLRFDHLDEADRVAAQAAESAEVQQEHWCIPEIIRIRSGILAARGEVALAISRLADSFAQARQMGALAWQLRSATDLAIVTCDDQGRDKAAALLRETLDLFSEGFATSDFVRASHVLADLEGAQDGCRPRQPLVAGTGLSRPLIPPGDRRRAPVLGRASASFDPLSSSAG